MSPNDSVTKKECDERHGNNRNMILGLGSMMLLCLGSVGYSVKASWDACNAVGESRIETKEDLVSAASEAAKARSEAASNGRMLSEIYQDIREIRASIMRIEKNDKGG